MQAFPTPFLLSIPGRLLVDFVHSEQFFPGCVWSIHTLVYFIRLWTLFGPLLVCVPQHMKCRVPELQLPSWVSGDSHHCWQCLANKPSSLWYHLIEYSQAFALTWVSVGKWLLLKGVHHQAQNRACSVAGGIAVDSQASWRFKALTAEAPGRSVGTRYK